MRYQKHKMVLLNSITWADKGEGVHQMPTFIYMGSAIMRSPFFKEWVLNIPLSKTGFVLNAQFYKKGVDF